MIVVDASVLIEALTNDLIPGQRCRARLAGQRVVHAPDHFRAEVFHGLRGRVLGGHLAPEKGVEAINHLARFRVRTLRRPTQLFGRMWELRANLTAYDAAYVALAELRQCPLVTADARLAAAPGLRCEVRLATAT